MRKYILLIILISLQFASTAQQRVLDQRNNQFELQRDSWLQQADIHFDLRNFYTSGQELEFELTEISCRDLISDVPGVRTTHFYTDSTEISTLYNWDDDNWEWNPITFRLYTFNEDNLITQVSWHAWDGAVGNWDSYPSFTRLEYNYDAQNRLTSIYNYEDFLDIFLYIETYTYEDDKISDIDFKFVRTNGDTTLSRESKLNYSNNLLEYESRVDLISGSLFDSIHYTYNEDNLISYKELHTYYPFESDTVSLRGTFEYAYDSLGRLDYYTESKLPLGVISQQDRHEYEYLADGSLKTIETWNPNSNIIFPFAGVTFEYDSSIPFKSIRYPREFLTFRFGDNTQSKILGSEFYYGIDVVECPPIRFGGIATYFYTKLSTSTEETSRLEPIILGPNPTRNELTFFGELGLETTLEIINNSGQKVLSVDLSPHSPTIDISILPTGMYHYRLHSEKYLQTGAFVKVD